VAVNNGDAYVAACEAGFGIIQVPATTSPASWPPARWWRCCGLPPPPLPLTVLYPQNRHLSPRVRVFIDWLAELFRCLNRRWHCSPPLNSDVRRPIYPGANTYNPPCAPSVETTLLTILGITGPIFLIIGIGFAAVRMASWPAPTCACWASSSSTRCRRCSSRPCRNVPWANWSAPIC
jgi:hypothetical protein